MFYSQISGTGIPVAKAYALSRRLLHL